MSDNITNFDATIKPLGEQEYKVEITFCKDGELERLQTEYLNQRGSVPLTHEGGAGEIRSALKKREHIEVVAKDKVKTQEVLITKLHECIQKKIDKKYSSDTVRSTFRIWNETIRR